MTSRNVRFAAIALASLFTVTDVAWEVRQESVASPPASTLAGDAANSTITGASPTSGSTFTTIVR